MKMMSRRTAAALAAALLPCSAFAAFEYAPLSARSASMGASSLSSFQESAAIFTNPAGIARLDSSEVSFLYARPYAGLDDVALGLGHASLAVPTRAGNLGVGYASFDANGMMSERTTVLSYSSTLMTKRLAVGVSAKHLSHTFSPGGDPLANADPVFANGTSASAWAYDVGGSFAVNRFMTAGVAVRNLNEPEVGLVTEDKVAREIQAGVMLDFSGTGFKVTGDMLMRQAAEDGVKQDPVPHFGMEKGFGGRFALRAGASSEAYSGGLGLRFGRVGLDYAMSFAKNLIQDNAGSHSLGMSYKFGKAK